LNRKRRKGKKKEEECPPNPSPERRRGNEKTVSPPRQCRGGKEKGGKEIAPLLPRSETHKERSGAVTS